jgi:fumarate reductase subunit D
MTGESLGAGAALLHRVSGVALALFLPLHFWALGQAIAGPEALGEFLRWTEHPLLKASEVGLVTALALHLTGGVRVLVVEFAPWRPGWHRDAVTVSIMLSLTLGLLFSLGLIA